MRKISSFAYKHFAIAQVLITICHLILVGLAMQLAGMLDQMNVFLSPKLLAASLILFAFIASVYRNSKKYVSKRLKYFVCGLLLFISLCCFYSNNSNVRYNLYMTAGGTIINPIEKNLSKSQSQQRKDIRKMVNELRKEIKASKGSTGKTFAIIGVILGAILLTLVVAGLSCSLACNGSGVLATLVILGGLFGIIWLANWAVKKINNKKPNPEGKQQVD